MFLFALELFFLVMNPLGIMPVFVGLTQQHAVGFPLYCTISGSLWNQRNSRIIEFIVIAIGIKYIGSGVLACLGAKKL